MNTFKLCNNNYIALVCMWYLYFMLGRLKICILCLSFTPCFHLIFHCNYITPSRSLTIPNFPRCHVFRKMEEEYVIKARVHITEFIYKKRTGHTNSWVSWLQESFWVWRKRVQLQMWEQLLGVGLVLSVPQKCKRNSFLFHIVVADLQPCGVSGFEYGGDLSNY